MMQAQLKSQRADVVPAMRAIMHQHGQIMGAAIIRALLNRNSQAVATLVRISAQRRGVPSQPAGWGDRRAEAQPLDAA